MSTQRPEDDPNDADPPGTISDADRAEIKGRSSELGSKLDKFRSRTAPEPSSKGTRSRTGAMADAMKLAIEPAVGVVVGVGVGVLADNALGTRPLFLIVGLLLGGAAGMANLFRAARKTTMPSSPPAEKDSGEGGFDGRA